MREEKVMKELGANGDSDEAIKVKAVVLDLRKRVKDLQTAGANAGAQAKRARSSDSVQEPPPTTT